MSATIIVAGTNITMRAARMVVKEDSIGMLDTYIRADWPKPLTMTSEREANRKVRESLSPVFRNPIRIPKITRNA